MTAEAGRVVSALRHSGAARILPERTYGVLRYPKRMRPASLALAAVVAVVTALSAPVATQDLGLDRLRGMPGVDAYAQLQEQLRDGPAFVSGAITPTWAADGRSFTYTRGGSRHRFDIATATDAVVADETGRTPVRLEIAPLAAGPCPATSVDRGRQRACEPSPDRTQKAYYRDRNLYISQADGSGEIAVTQDGDERRRIKYGAASWVYGEELEQTTAIWWAPDGRKVAFYRFDESRVKDYYLELDQTRLQSSVDVEAYPKAGSDNPIADVLVYDLDTRRTAALNVRDGHPFSDEVVGHYVYGIEWAADSRHLRMFRMDRRQQHLEYIACPTSADPCRILFSESRPSGWIETRPEIRRLRDGHRFLVASERSGWRNYYLVDEDTGLTTPVTQLGGAEAGSIVRVDEAAQTLYYMARDGDNFMKSQLHRVGFDGRDDVRLTDPAFTHTVNLAPDGQHFVDVYQAHDHPPASRVVDADGRVIGEIAASDTSRLTRLGLRAVEQFSFLAADGVTRLYGTMAFPVSFDPAKRYPVLLSVYAGPESAASVPSEAYAVPSTMTEYGFLVVTLGTRAEPGHGRDVLDELYLHLGRTEVDDLAAGVRSIAARPYVDRGRVGIYGTSYGGYVALMSLLRYPDVFAAAAASSAPTDWRLYDTIYTERYMGLPKDHAAEYDASSALTYVDHLEGRLLIYYGTADNNVHPSHSLQLIQALTRAGKSHEVQVGPDQAHSSVPTPRMMEFFLDNLVLRPERLRVGAPAAVVRN